MKGNNFGLIFIVIFIAAAIFGVLVFANIIKIGNQKDTAGSLGTVTLWGTDSIQTVSPALEIFNKANPTFVVKYVQKFPETFDSDLLEALASGTGPDMFFISNDLAQKYSNKIYVIPYASYPLASFRGSFATAGEVFLTSKGVLAFPVSIDPIVMYYNRSTLDSNNIVYPPANWDEMSSLVPLLTKKDSTNKITKSAVAMGQFSNVKNSKNILNALFMQAGNQIVVEKDGIFSSALDLVNPNFKISLDSMLKYYTDFSNPQNTLYSWNRSLPNSSDAFSSEDLAFYFGYASELKILLEKNPNQNFLAAPIPQIKNSNYKTTEARVNGIAIAASSKNFNTAFLAASLLATTSFASDYAKATSSIPARRDLLSEKKTDAFFPIFYSSALFARSWIDPSDSGTDDIYKTMIDGVLSNGMSPFEAINDASAKLNLLLMR